MSHVDPPSYEAHQEEPRQEEPHKKELVNPDSYLGGLYDTSLPHLYVERIYGNVWVGEIYLFTFTLHLFHTNRVTIDVDIIIFTGARNDKIYKPC